MTQQEELPWGSKDLARGVSEARVSWWLDLLYTLSAIPCLLTHSLVQLLCFSILGKMLCKSILKAKSLASGEIFITAPAMNHFTAGISRKSWNLEKGFWVAQSSVIYQLGRKLFNILKILYLYTCCLSVSSAYLPPISYCIRILGHIKETPSVVSKSLLSSMWASGDSDCEKSAFPGFWPKRHLPVMVWPLPH